MEKFNQYFLNAIKNNYANFDGRASRSEYWYFVLFYFLVSVVAAFIDTLVINPMLGATPGQASQGGMLQMILALGLLLPSIGLGIRRLHDIGKSGWWLLAGLIPILGFFLLLYFYATDSQPGENLYGPNPKGL